ncbi:MAG: BolA family protein [Gammaproteobacteria bacterium]|nr:BolA family protein [Gammaproteobacteria bacterium]
MNEAPDNTARMERMRESLAALEPVALEIKDESHKHVGHAGAQSGMGHFAMTIASPAFEGKSTLERHRLVYDTLGEMMHTDIHALSIRALTPEDIDTGDGKA